MPVLISHKVSISVLGEGLYASIEPSEVYSNMGFVQSVPNTMYITVFYVFLGL